jgi:DNA-binding NtrC family response regulator
MIPQAPAVRNSITAPDRRERPLVVVADDDRDMRAIVCTFLEIAGFDALPASGGAEALEICVRSTRHVALLISDVRMPDFTGPELAMRVEQQRPGIPVLFITGGEPPEIPDARKWQWDVLMKPFRQQALARRAHRLLQRSAASDR